MVHIYKSTVRAPLQNSAPHKYHYISGLLFGFQIFRSEGKEEGRTAVSKNKDMFEGAGRASDKKYSDNIVIYRSNIPARSCVGKQDTALFQITG